MILIQRAAASSANKVYVLVELEVGGEWHNWALSWLALVNVDQCRHIWRGIDDLEPLGCSNRLEFPHSIWNMLLIITIDLYATSIILRAVGKIIQRDAEVKPDILVAKKGFRT